MAFLGLRMLSPDGEEVSPRQAFRRLVWTGIAALPLGLGFWGILFEERRCGWPDRRADTRVLYADPDLDRAETSSRSRPVRDRRPIDRGLSLGWDGGRVRRTLRSEERSR